jgi:surface antigen
MNSKMLGAVIIALSFSVNAQQNVNTAASVSQLFLSSEQAILRALSDRDKNNMAIVLTNSPPYIPLKWNTDNNTFGILVQGTHFDFSSGAHVPCRDFIVDAIINGEFYKAPGTACRNPNGTWKLTGLGEEQQ